MRATAHSKIVRYRRAALCDVGIGFARQRALRGVDRTWHRRHSHHLGAQGQPWRSTPVSTVDPMKNEMPERDFSHAKRAKDIPALARLQHASTGKERITIRLDADVLAWFRNQVKGGGSYQNLINDTLRAAIGDENTPVTVGRLRAVLRQELHVA